MPLITAAADCFLIQSGYQGDILNEASRVSEIKVTGTLGFLLLMPLFLSPRSDWQVIFTGSHLPGLRKTLKMPGCLVIFLDLKPTDITWCFLFSNMTRDSIWFSESWERCIFHAQPSTCFPWYSRYLCLLSGGSRKHATPIYFPNPWVTWDLRWQNISIWPLQGKGLLCFLELF